MSPGRCEAAPLGRLLIASEVGRPPLQWVAEIRDYLARHRIGVEQVPSPREAVRAVERGGWDAAVLTAGASGSDGLSELKVIRSFAPEVSCVVVAADTSERMLRRSLALGAYSVIPQPVDVPCMARVLTGLFRRRLGIRWEPAATGTLQIDGEGVVEPWLS